MTKKIVLKIESCLDCPRLNSYIDKDGVGVYECSSFGSPQFIADDYYSQSNINEIPSWCPLLDW